MCAQLRVFWHKDSLNDNHVTGAKKDSKSADSQSICCLFLPSDEVLGLVTEKNHILTMPK